jgi:hypothetical protein
MSIRQAECCVFIPLIVSQPHLPTGTLSEANRKFAKWIFKSMNETSPVRHQMSWNRFSNKTQRKRSFIYSELNPGYAVACWTEKRWVINNNLHYLFSPSVDTDIRLWKYLTNTGLPNMTSVYSNCGCPDKHWRQINLNISWRQKKKKKEGFKFCPHGWFPWRCHNRRY